MRAPCNEWTEMSNPTHSQQRFIFWLLTCAEKCLFSIPNWALRCGVVSNTPSSMLVKMATAYHTGTLESPALRTNVEPNCLGIKMWCGFKHPFIHVGKDGNCIPHQYSWIASTQSQCRADIQVIFMSTFAMQNCGTGDQSSPTIQVSLILASFQCLNQSNPREVIICSIICRWTFNYLLQEI